MGTAVEHGSDAGAIGSSPPTAPADVRATVTVTVNGVGDDLTIADLCRVAEALRSAAVGGPTMDLVVDLTGLTHADRRFVRGLAALSADLRGDDVPLTVRGPAGTDLLTVLSAAPLDEVFDVYRAVVPLVREGIR